jgi:Tfp pilus assembly protein PilF
VTAIAIAKAFYDNGQLRDSLPYFRQALQEQPGDVDVLYRAMLTLMAMRDYAGCARWLSELLPHVDAAKSPSWMMGGFHYNLGVAYEASGQWQDAAAQFAKALDYEPNAALPIIELGSLAYRNGKPDDGKAWHQRALAMDVHDEDAKPARAFVRLLHGDYLGGFAEYESRWKLAQVIAQTTIPKDHWRWKGKDLEGKRIVVISEQGVGDTIQFCRYLPLIEERGGKVTLLCQQSLVTLMQHNYPTIEVIAHGEPFRPARWWTSLMSLPHIFGTTIETIPSASQAYLTAPGCERSDYNSWNETSWDFGGGYPPPAFGPETYAKWKSVLRVGYATKGNPLYMADKDRSSPPGAFDHLLTVPGVTFIDLDGPEVRPLDMLEAAKVYRSLDLVISVDTAARHFAGALGVPCWLLAQCAPYWVDGFGETSPWYANHRIFRREHVNDWPGVMHRVRAALEAR